MYLGSISVFSGQMINKQAARWPWRSADRDTNWEGKRLVRWGNVWGGNCPTVGESLGMSG